MRIVDRIAITDMVMTGEGYLRLAAKIARTGVQDYYGYEIGRTEDEALRVFRVYRDPAEVFAPEALASFKLKPVTDAHPFESVTAENWSKQAKGVIAEDVRRDGEHMAATLFLTDAEIINRVQRKGSVELSCGYDCELDMTGGVTEAGETYDGRQIGIRGNHVAIVDQGRCGPSCATNGDDAMPSLTDCPGQPRCQCKSTPATKGQDEMTTKTVTVDGTKLEVTADVAAVIEGLQAKAAHGDRVKDAAMQLAEIVERHTKIKADEIAAKDAKIAELEGKVPTADAIQSLADERAALVNDAKVIAPDVDPKGKDAATIRKDAVVAAIGDAKALDGKSPEYIAATFDMLVAKAKSDGAEDPIRNAMKSGKKDSISPQQSYRDSIANAWKGA